MVATVFVSGITLPIWMPMCLEAYTERQRTKRRELSIKEAEINDKQS